MSSASCAFVCITIVQNRFSKVTRLRYDLWNCGAGDQIKYVVFVRDAAPPIEGSVVTILCCCLPSLTLGRQQVMTTTLIDADIRNWYEKPCGDRCKHVLSSCQHSSDVPPTACGVVVCHIRDGCTCTGNTICTFVVHASIYWEQLTRHYCLECVSSMQGISYLSTTMIKHKPGTV